MSEKTYTRDQVSKAVNDGASLVEEDPDIYLDDRDHDLLNLVVNAIMGTLDEPGVSLDEVIEENYSPDVDDDDDDDRTVIQIVKGWLDQ